MKLYYLVDYHREAFIEKNTGLPFLTDKKDVADCLDLLMGNAWTADVYDPPPSEEDQDLTDPDPLQITEYVPPVDSPGEWYIAQGHHSKHSGLDINLNKPPYGDVELGMPVYATCNGLVVFAGPTKGTSWGNVVIILSIDDGELIFWRYGHLLDYIDVGEYVKTGDIVGSIGKGYNNRYPAHLHLDCWTDQMIAPNAWLDTSVEWHDPLDVWGNDWEWGTR